MGMIISVPGGEHHFLLAAKMINDNCQDTMMSGLMKKMRPVDNVEAEVSCITVLQVLEIKRVIKECFLCI